MKLIPADCYYCAFQLMLLFSYSNFKSKDLVNKYSFKSEIFVADFSSSFIGVRQFLGPLISWLVSRSSKGFAVNKFTKVAYSYVLGMELCDFILIFWSKSLCASYLACSEKLPVPLKIGVGFAECYGINLEYILQTFSNSGHVWVQFFAAVIFYISKSLYFQKILLIVYWIQDWSSDINGDYYGYPRAKNINAVKYWFRIDYWDTQLWAFYSDNLLRHQNLAHV